mmetsp:Transcript_18439/g.23734  ORF Transcript_18439/g.23734 Transcript_18439/m.23734 type:complete len:503 (+) Transcript_18439:54-1562(+)
MSRPGREAKPHALLASAEALETFHEDVDYLWCGGSGSNSIIPVYDEPPSAIEFLRNHVSVSRPCIIRNSIRSSLQPKSQSQQPFCLTLDDLVSYNPDLELFVDVTPDGHGDCLRYTKDATTTAKETANPNSSQSQKIFVKPMERKMPISTFTKHLRQGRKQQILANNTAAAAADFNNDNHILQQPDEETNFLEVDSAIKNRVFEIDNNCTTPTADDNEVDTAIGADVDIDLDQCVLYYSRQNDCLRKELGSLWSQQQQQQQKKEDDPSLTSFDATTTKNNKNDSSSLDLLFPRSFSWAEEAFGVSEPDAVNLWIGDERSVSSMHKDHYENLFYVLQGEKVFTLCPPADAPFLYEQPVRSGKFVATTNTTTRNKKDKKMQLQWNVQLDHNDATSAAADHDDSAVWVHWIAANVLDEKDLDEFPLLAHTHVFPQVRVQAGDMLYLPSLWFHRVTQTCETIGINYWYDMKFESPSWCYFHLLQQLQLTDDNDKRKQMPNKENPKE